MRQDWKPGMKLQEALDLTAKVLVKTMDTASPTAVLRQRDSFGETCHWFQGHGFHTDTSAIGDEVGGRCH